MKLKVGEETFYVSKLFLAGQSAYFKTMFLGKFAEANQLEVELKDIEPDVFHYFLEVLHGELVVRETLSGTCGNRSGHPLHNENCNHSAFLHLTFSFLTDVLYTEWLIEIDRMLTET
ncbi:hypothetical protein CAEBREN_18013 [Caenorhabditis brenneri]|uniref:BTB domain-containing protein n=1 Tax=Caenorhabditis brenneri TaxID=135651 RepID=G0P7M6_CAEBE|nr:hypothetical protein CAEBREN_18013 [Caenorhabditis brenneri]